ncbi:hypothetical protein [Streptomyces sp. HUAS TT20]|uniref:hypothetical protein n=1 Tax=Streptomyces sp. HUAS TT20 TaxID=3447509 RepID=UPI0021D93009|nr:hypothetical protein [Streptomyces sp. HUAS 15-9]UXY32383.1 hypothetical protein N8I87_41780 [Streptomyces sp. HUAS 15-9]
MDQIRELAALLHPMPEPGSVTPDDCFSDACDQVERERKDYADNLEAAAFGTEGDPVILALEQARAEKEEADRRIRRILAYAKEFQPPRRYILDELGRASGYSISGVRTAYTPEEIGLVQSQIRRDPRRSVSGEDPS